MVVYLPNLIKGVIVGWLKTSTGLNLTKRPSSVQAHLSAFPVLLNELLNDSNFENPSEKNKPRSEFFNSSEMLTSRAKEKGKLGLQRDVEMKRWLFV